MLLNYPTGAFPNLFAGQIKNKSWQSQDFPYRLALGFTPGVTFSRRRHDDDIEHLPIVILNEVKSQTRL